MADHRRYTCADYRQEMMLLSLQLRLHEKDLPEPEKENLVQEIKRLESAMHLAD